MPRSALHAGVWSALGLHRFCACCCNFVNTAALLCPEDDHVLVVTHCLWLLLLLCSLLQGFLSLESMVQTPVLFRAEYSAVSGSLQLDRLWVAVLRNK